MLVDPDEGFFFVWPLSVVLIAPIAAGPRLRFGSRRLFVALLIAETAYIGAQQMNYTTSAPRYSRRVVMGVQPLVMPCA